MRRPTPDADLILSPVDRSSRACRTPHPELVEGWSRLRRRRHLERPSTGSGRGRELRRLVGEAPGAVNRGRAIWIPPGGPGASRFAALRPSEILGFPWNLSSEMSFFKGLRRAWARIVRRGAAKVEIGGDLRAAADRATTKHDDVKQPAEIPPRDRVAALPVAVSIAIVLKNRTKVNEMFSVNRNIKEGQSGRGCETGGADGAPSDDPFLGLPKPDPQLAEPHPELAKPHPEPVEG